MAFESIELLFVAGPGEGRTLELVQGTHVIGREPGPGGIELDGDPTISRRHAQILVAPDGVVFENLSANGSKVNGQLVQGRLRLSGGEEIMVGGRHRLAVRLPSGVAGVASVAQAEVVEAPAAPERAAAPAPRASKASRPAPARSRSSTPARRGSSRKNVPAEVEPEEEPTLLQKPWVRMLLGVYGAGMIVALALAGGDGAGRGAPFPSKNWNLVDSEYRQVFAEAAQLDDEEAQERLLRGYEIYQRMRVHWDRGDVRSYEQSIGKLMAIDGDPRSPIYQYAVRAAGVRPQR